MNLFGINEYEFVLIVLIALLVLGPERLPEYAGKLARAVKSLRRYAEGARAQLKDQMGPEFEQVDWAAYDPRSYDPRRIVREALADVDLRPASLVGGVSATAPSLPAGSNDPAATDADHPLATRPADVAAIPAEPELGNRGPRRTPWDDEAT